MLWRELAMHYLVCTMKSFRTFVPSAHQQGSFPGFAQHQVHMLVVLLHEGVDGQPHSGPRAIYGCFAMSQRKL